MIDGGNFFDQPIKNNLRTHENIRKITNGQGDDCLLVICYLENFSNQYN